MNVALFLTYGYSIKTWKDSGTLDREISIYKNLNKVKNVQFYIISYGNASDEALVSNEDGIKVLPIYKYFNKSKYRFVNLIRSFSIPKLVKNNLNEISIVQQHQLHGCWVSILYSFLIRKPYYLRTGYDMYLFSIQERKSFLIRSAYKLLTNLGLRFSNIYSVTNKSDLAFLTNKYTKHSNKLKLRPNFVEVNYSDFNKRDNNKILCVGRIEEQKNFGLLIKEFQNTADKLEIDLVGEGSLKNDLSKSALKNKVKINFLGMKNNNELLKMYTNYKFFITTSKFEGNPKTLLEAMASGCVVFASDIPNHEELIKNEIDGFLFSLINPELQKLFFKVKNQSSALNKISNNAIKKVDIHNNLNNLVENTFKDYELILNK